MHSKLILSGLAFAAVAVASAPGAAVVLTEDDGGVFGVDSIGEFTGDTDVDPQGLGVLSSGSLVFFDSEAGIDAVLLFDPSGPASGKFSTLLSESAMLALDDQAAGTNSSIGDLVVGSNDDVYVMVRNTTPTPDVYFIVRVPSLGVGTDNFASPELVFGSSDFGGLNVPSRIAIDQTASPELLYFSVDDDNLANDGTTNGIYSIPVTAANSVSATLVGTLAQVSAAGGTAGKGTAGALTYVESLGQVLIMDSASNSSNRGNTVLMNTGTGVCTTFVDGRLIGGTPTGGACVYDSVSDEICLVWASNLSTTSGVDDDRIEIYDTAGSLQRTMYLEDDLIPINPNNLPTRDLGAASNSIATDGVSYYFFDTNNGSSDGNETLWQIGVTVPVEMSVFSSQ